MLGVHLWVTPGPRGCDRCGAQRELTSAGWLSMQWCADCLLKKGGGR